jgi:hypothetical protein
LVEETEESELMDISIVAATVGLEDDVCLMDVDFLWELCWVGDELEEKLWLWQREL